MYALIEKETNKILRTGAEFIPLSEAKSFYWVECPQNAGPSWTYDGSEFSPPIIAPAAPPHPNNAIYDQIRDIEYSITNRRLREAVLTESGAAWLAEREAEIEVLRQQLI